VTEAEVQRHLKAALEEQLPTVIQQAYEKVCAEQSQVVERAREESDTQKQAELLLKDKREGRVWKWIVAPLMTVALGGGGFGIYQNRATEATVDDRVGELEEVIVGCKNGEQDTCPKEKKKQSVTGRVNTAEKKIDRLGELHFQQLQVIVDQGEEQRLKLDTMSPEAKAIPKPKSVEDAEEAVEAYEKLKQLKSDKKKAAEAASKGDAFAGIDEE
jgi:hypothetical protein